MKELIHNPVLERNGGLHSYKQYKLAIDMVDEIVTTYKSARLYHICFTGSDLPSYQCMLKDLMRRLDRKGIRADYQACYEICETKGAHYHVFLFCESSEVNPCSVLNCYPDGWLVMTAARYGIEVELNKPRGAMHQTGIRKLSYIALPKTKQEKIWDAKIWISYLYKNRTKPDSGSVYSSSRRSRKSLH